MQNNMSFDKLRPVTVTCCFPSSSHFQINGGASGDMNWGHWVHYTTNLSSQQLAARLCVCVCVCVCVFKCECVLESVCVCVYSIWAVASSVNLCTIECDTTWWWEEPGALKWYVVMTAPNPLLLLSRLSIPFFPHLASFFLLPLFS